VRLSAAVILAREPLELFMVHRHARSDAFADVWVFPGGTVDPIDRVPGAGAWAFEELTNRGGDPPTDQAEALAILRCAARELREEACVTVDPQDLRYFSHWVTPEGSPRRFDTRFFVAAMPPEQEAACCGVETVEGAWVTAERALEALPLVFPTRKHLERIAGLPNLAALLELAATKTIATVRPSMPRPTIGAAW